MLCRIQQYYTKEVVPTLKKPKLHYTFHNPNGPEETAAFLIKLFIEVNQPKVEQIIRQAQEAALDSPSESSSAAPT